MTVLLFIVFLAILSFGIVRVVLPTIRTGKLTYLRAIPWFAGAFVALLLFSSFTTVGTGNRDVVTRFGNVTRVLPPGAHLVLPFIESANPVSVQTLVVKPSEDASSHDLQVVHTQVTLAYHFDPNHVDYIFTHYIDSSDNAVENKVVNPAILEAIKAVTAQYDAQSLISDRAKVRDGIEAFVQARLARNYIVPESVSITDFHFSPEYDKSIEAKVTAQQQAEKAVNDLRRIEVEAQQAAAEAKGKAEATAAEAHGDAEATLSRADAQAKANRELAASITPQLIQYRAIEKWDGARPMVEGKGSGLLIQVPSARPSKSDDQGN